MRMLRNHELELCAQKVLINNNYRRMMSMIMMMSKCNYREYRTKDVKQQRVNFIGSELFEIFRCLNAFHTHKKERSMHRKDLLQFFDILIKKI